MNRFDVGLCFLFAPIVVVVCVLLIALLIQYPMVGAIFLLSFAFILWGIHLMETS